jgi:hypothetical protein
MYGLTLTYYLSITMKRSMYNLELLIVITTQVDISYKNKYIVNDTNTRFLGTSMDSSLSWKNHIDGLMVKQYKACCAIRSLRPFVSYESLKMIYYSYFLSVMSYGIIFWGNFSHSNNNLFKLQKRIIRIITNSRNMTCLRN